MGQMWLVKGAGLSILVTGKEDLTSVWRWKSPLYLADKSHRKVTLSPSQESKEDVGRKEPQFALTSV